MAVDLTAFRNKFQITEHPELSAASDVTVEEEMDIAKSIFVLTDLGTLYLTAHLVLLAEKEKINVGAGALASEGTGPHSESYRESTRDLSSPLYDTTPYGRRFLLLKRTATAARVMII